VIGGGVIGLAIALESRRAGFNTLMIDSDRPGDGCSFGNAGLIATSEIRPLSSIGRLVEAPRMLCDPLGPLALRTRDIGRLAPWLARFAMAAAPSRRKRATSALATLLSGAAAAWRDLLDACEGRSLLIERGTVEVARTEAGLRRLERRRTELLDHGVRADCLDRQQVSDLEPLLGDRTSGGLFHPATMHVTSPLRVCETLRRGFQAAGGQHLTDRVVGLEPRREECVIHGRTSATTARRVVVAAGVWSSELLAPLGAMVPLEAERGYHLMVRGCPQPSRPIMFSDESFVATPMDDGLRLAGTVELAAPCAPPNWARAERLRSLAGRYLADLPGKGATRWMGRRPSLPDSLPAIGMMGSEPSVLYAFGHQHLGLTLAAITARCVLALLEGSPPPIALELYSLDRFARRSSRA
jgi:D-amino-acid dehydrogenase